MDRAAGARRALVWLAALTVVMAPIVARAAVRTVSLSANQFSPISLDTLVPGDTVRWNWLDGIHNVTAYNNGTFSSGDQAPPFSFTQSFEGGVVKYRCTNHSSLSSDRCSGMCGILTDKPLDLTPPEIKIDEPKAEFPMTIVRPDPTVGANGVNNLVLIKGTATDDTAVFAIQIRLYDTTGKAKEYMSTCTGCYTPSATWSLTVNLLPGSYIAEAIGADTSGNLPKTAPRRAFIVV